MQHILRAMPRPERSTAWFGNGMPRAMGYLLRSLRGRHDWHGDADKRMFMAAKYIARCLTVFRQHAGFLSLVEREPALQAFRRRDPRMLERHLHRYLHRGWHRAQRLRAIHWHYRHVLAAMPAPLFRAVYVEGAAPLGLLTLKDGSRLILSLLPPIFLGCEGELRLQLGDEFGNPLYSIVVTVIGEGTLAIGCIQGPVGGAARETVRELTRNLHGLRPRCLMLMLARALAQHWGLSRLLAVGNLGHPLRNPRRRFVADYDAYWDEQQGRTSGDGWYELPLRPQAKSEAEVPSRHRSAFRKRETLRMEAERLLVDALGPMPGHQRQHERPVDMQCFNHRLQGAYANAS